MALGLWTSARAQTRLPTARSAASPEARARRLVARRLGSDPSGQNLAQAYAQAMRQTARQLAAQTASSAAWTAAGPAQVSTSRYGLVTGRVTSIAADPSDPSGNTVYAGSTGGGVWRSTNAAGPVSQVSFAPLTDDLSVFAPPSVGSLSIGALAVQPGGTGVILAGTGDPNEASDSYYGVGILRSTDNGQHWVQISTADLSSPNRHEQFFGVAFAGFAWNSLSPNIVVAAVTDSPVGAVEDAPGPGNQSLLGLYVSTDSGATWSLATLSDGTTVIESNNLVSQQGNAATGVAWNPVRQRFYAAIRYHGYYESADGANWTRLTNQPGAGLTPGNCPANPSFSGDPGCPIYRGAIAVQPQTSDMYAITVDSSDNDQGIWQDICTAGSSGCANPVVQFSNQIADTSIEQGTSGTIANATYNLSLAAVPSQADTLLFAGAEDLFRCSLNQGCQWRNTTNAAGTAGCAAAMVAPSQHAIESTFGASGLLYFGNDGGLWRTTDAVNQQQPACGVDDATHFQNLNGGLGSLAEASDVAVSPGGNLLVALGSLGTAAGTSASSAWTQALDGDAEHVAIDPNNSQNWFATTSTGVAISECTQGESCNPAAFQPVIGATQVGPEDAAAQTEVPWMLDPVDSSQMLLGTCRVWRGAADGVGWSASSALSYTLDGDQQEPYCDGNAPVASIGAGAAGSSAESFFAGIVNAASGGGLVPGHIFTQSVSLPANGPTSWQDLTESPVTNTPGSRFNGAGFTLSSIYVDPHDPTGNTVYVTVQGFASSAQSGVNIYGSTDGGQTWQALSNNLPIVPANSVVVDPNDANTVYIATDAGVWVTRDIAACSDPAEACWSLMGTGLPNAPVIKLVAIQQGTGSTLYAATYGRGVWQTAGLAALGVAAGSVTPATLNFGDQRVQTDSLPQTVTVTSTGTAPLVITGYTASGDFQAASGACQTALPAGNSCSISVTFTPSATGQRSGILTVHADVTGGQLQVDLAGVGTAPGAIVTTPASLTFAQSLIGTTTPAQDVTISNTGGTSIAISQISVSGDFALTSNTCGTQLASQSGCTVAIAFTPTASGNRGGELVVVDAQGTQAVPLSGSGESPATDTVAPTSLSFAQQQIGTTSAAQAVTLSNSGDYPLNQISAASSGDFVVVNDCGTALPGHSTCSMLVTFSPTKIGGESGTLTITDALGAHSVLLTGTGQAGPGVTVSPNQLNFGGYGAGASPPAQSITLRNNGGVDLSGITASTTGSFAISANGCAGSLPVGSQCSISVVFSPAVAGSDSGSLSIAVASSSQTYTVPLSGSGDDFQLAGVGASSQTITSGSSASYSFTATPLGGTTGPISFTCSIAITDATCTVAPSAATCASAPSQCTLNGQTAFNVQVTVATGVTTTSANWQTRAGIVLAFGLPLWFSLHKSAPRLSRHLAIVAVASVLAFGISACGVKSSAGTTTTTGGGGSTGSGGTGQATPSGTYPVTLTASMPGIEHSLQVTVNVE